MKQPSTDCIIVAAGSGKRLGKKTPKAFINLGGIPLFMHSLLLFARHDAINKIILVVSADLINKARQIIKKYPVKKQVGIIAGGEHRWQSVQNGVAASRADWIMIHDSARPFLTRAIIDAVFAASKKYDAVIATTPEVDTVRTFAGDRAGNTIDRSGLVRVQTPQLFRRTQLIKTFDRAASLSPPPTDEAMLMEAAGVPVGIAPGDPLNFKITTKEDLAIAQALCKKSTRRVY